MLNVEKGTHTHIHGLHLESFEEYQDKEAGGSGNPASESLRNSCMFLAPS